MHPLNDFSLRLSIVFHVTNSGYSSSVFRKDAVELEDREDFEEAFDPSLVKVWQLEFDGVDEVEELAEEELCIFDI